MTAKDYMSQLPSTNIAACKCAACLTLRDYFAGQALAAVLVSPNFRYLIDSADEASTKDIVERAYWFADAMLDERMEEPK